MGPVNRILLGIVILAATAARADAQTPAPPPNHAVEIPRSKIPRVQRAPTLEDFLENRPREAELTVSDFRQYTPGDGTPASETTTAYLSYDSKNLYVAFVCQDESGQVRAHLSKREDFDQDDGVGVLLDTFRDLHRAYDFFSNPLGVQTDAIYTEGQGYDYSFDTLWYTAGRVAKDSYLVDAARGVPQRVEAVVVTLALGVDRIRLHAQRIRKKIIRAVQIPKSVQQHPHAVIPIEVLALR